MRDILRMGSGTAEVICDFDKGKSIGEKGTYVKTT